MPCMSCHVMSCHVMSCHCIPRCYVDATGPGDAMEHDDNGYDDDHLHFVFFKKSKILFLMKNV